MSTSEKISNEAGGGSGNQSRSVATVVCRNVQGTRSSAKFEVAFGRPQVTEVSVDGCIPAFAAELCARKPTSTSLVCGPYYSTGASQSTRSLVSRLESPDRIWTVTDGSLSHAKDAEISLMSNPPSLVVWIDCGSGASIEDLWRSRLDPGKKWCFPHTSWGGMLGVGALLAVLYEAYAAPRSPHTGELLSLAPFLEHGTIHTAGLPPQGGVVVYGFSLRTLAEKETGDLSAITVQGYCEALGCQRIVVGVGSDSGDTNATVVRLKALEATVASLTLAEVLASAELCGDLYPVVATHRYDCVDSALWRSLHQIQEGHPVVSSHPSELFYIDQTSQREGNGPGARRRVHHCATVSPPLRCAESGQRYERPQSKKLARGIEADLYYLGGRAFGSWADSGNSSGSGDGATFDEILLWLDGHYQRDVERANAAQDGRSFSIASKVQQAHRQLRHLATLAQQSGLGQQPLHTDYRRGSHAERILWVLIALIASKPQGALFLCTEARSVLGHAHYNHRALPLLNTLAAAGNGACVLENNRPAPHSHPAPSSNHTKLSLLRYRYSADKPDSRKPESWDPKSWKPAALHSMSDTFQGGGLYLLQGPPGAGKTSLFRRWRSAATEVSAVYVDAAPHPRGHPAPLALGKYPSRCVGRQGSEKTTKTLTLIHQMACLYAGLPDAVLVRVRSRDFIEGEKKALCDRIEVAGYTFAQACTLPLSQVVTLFQWAPQFSQHVAWLCRWMPPGAALLTSVDTLSRPQMVALAIGLERIRVGNQERKRRKIGRDNTQRAVYFLDHCIDTLCPKERCCLFEIARQLTLKGDTVVVATVSYFPAPYHLRQSV